MDNIYSIRQALDANVSISEFNKGKAKKIFEAVSREGCKIVVKNNQPICVLIHPGTFLEMLEMLDRYTTAVEASKGTSKEKMEKFYEDVKKDIPSKFIPPK